MSLIVARALVNEAFYSCGSAILNRKRRRRGNRRNSQPSLHGLPCQSRLARQTMKRGGDLCGGRYPGCHSPTRFALGYFVAPRWGLEIGRASCRERGEISGGAVSFKK